MSDLWEAQYAKNVATLKKCQLRFDNLTPEDTDGDECPECGAAIKIHHPGVKCTECDWSAYPDEGPDDDEED